jgi:hypothetical protein
MNDSEVFEATCLLFEAAVFLKVSSFEPDPRAFGLACDEEVARGNEYAKSFFVANRVDGRHACEFNEMISMAYGAGFMHWRSGNRHVHVQMSPRHARELAAEHVAESRALARNYFVRVGALV